MEVAQAAIEEALQERVSLKELIGTLQTVLHGLDNPEIGPVESVMRELRDWQSLLHISIAYRAFAKGLQAATKPAQET